MNVEEQKIVNALGYIPAHDREVWLRVGMALHAWDSGARGLAMWRCWSETASNFDERALAASWRSFRRGGGITTATLFHLAREHGWRPDASERSVGVSPTKPGRRAVEAKEAALRVAQEQAAVRSRKILAECERQTHPYLAGKGFPDLTGFVASDSRLVIPLCTEQGDITSLQFITDRGAKKFLQGGRVRGCCHRIGRGREIWVCEGYATGLSLQQALQLMGRRVSVAIAFSAGNIPAVVETFRDITSRIFVIADNDVKSDAGRKAAEKTRCRWWMPPLAGDANDLHLSQGIDTLVRELQPLIRLH